MSPATRRRFTLQLAPLLDLLFIVLYAQYIDLQQATRREIEQATVQREQAQVAKHEADKLRTDALERLNDLNNKLEHADIEKRRLARELELARAETEKESQARGDLEKLATRDRQAIGQMVQNLLRINQDAILQALQGATPVDQQRLRAEFEEIKNTSPAGIIHHLRATVELKKRADLWEVYIDDNNSVRLTLVGNVVAEHVQIAEPDQLTNTLAEAARQRGEPKSLVVVLLSWSNADRRTRDGVRKAVDNLVTVMKAEWPGKRIEVAPLGYTPVPP
jgi:hypothetical protein